MQRKDISGMRFGSLVVLSYQGAGKWDCNCDCGNLTRVAKSNLKDGRTKSCGCRRVNIFNNLTGIKFGLLEAKKFSPPRKWFCVCDCGNEIEVFTDNLTRNHTKSCGCNKAQFVTNSKLRHGKADGKNKVYTAWHNMKDRCSNQNNKDYINYGGRGISVCETWLTFERFYKDMGEPPSKKHTLERVDVNGDYSPQNCEWATSSVQRNNQRRSKKYEFQGESHSLIEWCNIKNMPYARLAQRVEKLGWDFERAITVKDGRRKEKYENIVKKET